MTGEVIGLTQRARELQTALFETTDASLDTARRIKLFLQLLEERHPAFVSAPCRRRTFQCGLQDYLSAVTIHRMHELNLKEMRASELKLLEALYQVQLAKELAGKRRRWERRLELQFAFMDRHGSHPRRWFHTQQGRVEPGKAAAIHEWLAALAKKTGGCALEERVRDALSAGNLNEANPPPL
jgi:hypothetical protein